MKTVLTPIRANPYDLMKWLEADYGLTPYEAYNIVCKDRASDCNLEYFIAACKRCKTPKLVANWMLNDLSSALNAAKISLTECRVEPHYLGGLVRKIEQGIISNKQAKEVFIEMLKGRPASQVIKEKKFITISDPAKLKQLCLKVIADNPKPVADFRAGNKAPLNSLKGQIMKLSNGQANIVLASSILEKLLQ